MTEFGLILAINLGGLAFAALLARWLFGRDAGTTEMRRLAAAITRATDVFLWREFRLIAVGTLLFGALLFSVHAYLGHTGSPNGSFETAFWSALGLALGAATACLSAYAGARLGTLANVRTLSAARNSVDSALTVSIRASGATGLAVETLGIVGVCSLFGLVYSMKGGFALPPEQVGSLALRVATLLPGYAFGAVMAALVVQRGGSIFHAASDVGGDVAGEREAGLDHDDARNPAAIADLVGDHVGLLASRSADLFVSATITNVAALTIAASVQQLNRERLSGTLALVALPVVVRAFGVIGCAFGLMVVRTDSAENPSKALWRGHATASAVSLGGLLGASFWLVGQAYWIGLFLAGTLGVLAAVAVAHSVRYRTDRRFVPLRDVLDAIRGGDAITVAQGLGIGLEAALIPALALGAAMAGAWQLGASTGLFNGGLFGTVIALTTMLATAPYVLAVGNFGPIADNARGIAAMSLRGEEGEEEAERRTGKLDDAGFLAASVAETYLIVVGCIAALLAAAALPLFAGRELALAGSVDFTKPAVAWSGAFGAASVLAYAGNMLRAGARGARSVAIEVERQLRGFPRERGLAMVPLDYTPSYRACIDLVSHIALERILLPVGLALVLPGVLGIALRLMYRSSDPGLWAEGLMSFVVVASVTGLGAALVIDAARATLGAARRASRPRGTSAGFGASVTGDAVADLIGNSAGPAAHLVVKAAAVGSLLVAPFLK